MYNAQPFFILSNPRSGSSLLRIALDCHSELTVPPECGFIQWWYKKYSNWKVKDNYSERLNEFCKDIASSKKIETWDLDFIFFKELVLNCLPVNYSELTSLIYISFGLNRGKNIKMWGDKNNYYIHHVNLLNNLFPSAKYIFLVRDGRDVACSYRELNQLKSRSKYFPKLTSEISTIAQEWKENNENLLSFFESVSEQNKLIVKYEDLITDLEAELYRISKFINLPFDIKMLKYYEINQEHKIEPEIMIDWKKKTLKEPDSSGINKYKMRLSREEILSFNSIAINCLKYFDYEV